MGTSQLQKHSITGTCTSPLTVFASTLRPGPSWTAWPLHASNVRVAVHYTSELEMPWNTGPIFRMQILASQPLQGILTVDPLSECG